MKNLLLFVVLFCSASSFAQDHPFGDGLERQRAKRAKELAAKATDTITPAPTTTALPVATPATKTAPAVVTTTKTVRNTPEKPAKPAVTAPKTTPAPKPTPAHAQIVNAKPAPAPPATTTTTTVPDPTPAITTKPKHTVSAAAPKYATTEPAKTEPATTGSLVLIGQISQKTTSREVIMLAPRLIAQDASCDVSGYSFSISNSKGQSWGPMGAKGAEFTYQMKDKMKEWDGPCIITIDNIKLKCGGAETDGRPITLTYER